MTFVTNWPPLPFLPLDVPVYLLRMDPTTGPVFLYDDTGVDYSALTAASAVPPLCETPENGGSDFGADDLWLEIIAFTNKTALLGVNHPSGDTNVSHDLYYAEDLSPPIQWQFAMRCVYNQALVTDLCPPQGFFRLMEATNGVLTLDSGVTPAQMVEQLVPAGVTAANATYTGEIFARGTFSGGNGCGLPLESGVILATGEIADAVGPNGDSFVTTPFGNPGDTDLNGLVGGGPTYDPAILEFDIISSNSFRLGFQYVFASDEYPEWVAEFNDPVAIFVSTNRVGTNWINAITNDIALVPQTTNVIVSVNSIDGGWSSWGQIIRAPTKPHYYVDNFDPGFRAVSPYSTTRPAFNIQYDGMTVMLTAQATIWPNVTNHVKICIADYGDYLYDSAVFIRPWVPCP